MCMCVCTCGCECAVGLNSVHVHQYAKVNQRLWDGWLTQTLTHHLSGRADFPGSSLVSRQSSPCCLTPPLPPPVSCTPPPTPPPFLSLCFIQSVLTFNLLPLLTQEARRSHSAFLVPLARSRASRNCEHECESSRRA